MYRVLLKVLARKGGNVLLHTKREREINRLRRAGLEKCKGIQASPPRSLHITMTKIQRGYKTGKANINRLSFICTQGFLRELELYYHYLISYICPTYTPHTLSFALSTCFPSCILPLYPPPSTPSKFYSSHLWPRWSPTFVEPLQPTKNLLRLLVLLIITN